MSERTSYKKSIELLKSRGIQVEAGLTNDEVEKSLRRGNPSMREMIYDFATHSLYYENQRIDVAMFSLTINFLEMFFELQTGKLLYIQGFFPLIQAVESNISLPPCVKGEYLLHNFDLSMCHQNEVYYLTKKIPQTQKYFENTTIKYDRKKGIIQVGEEMGENETSIEVNKQIVCGLDRNSDLKCIYIIPTRFIGEIPQNSNKNFERILVWLRFCKQKLIKLNIGVKKY